MGTSQGDRGPRLLDEHPSAGSYVRLPRGPAFTKIADMCGVGFTGDEEQPPRRRLATADVDEGGEASTVVGIA